MRLCFPLFGNTSRQDLSASLNMIYHKGKTVFKCFKDIFDVLPLTKIKWTTYCTLYFTPHFKRKHDGTIRATHNTELKTSLSLALNFTQSKSEFNS